MVQFGQAIKQQINKTVRIIIKINTSKKINNLFFFSSCRFFFQLCTTFSSVPFVTGFIFLEWWLCCVEGAEIIFIHMWLTDRENLVN